ncbi:hypothetical protein [Spongiactinospora gelatinilytica]|nr:hypothetical protein [Spongiactinospora gelatinilytica]
MPWDFETFALGASTTGGLTSVSRRPDTMEVWWVGADGSIQHKWWYE